MCWLKRNLWKTGITIAGMLLLLVLMALIPVSEASAHIGASGLTVPVTVQATPTEDATVTALNKEKLKQELDQLKNQNYWAWTTIGPILVGFAGLLAALYSFITWIRNRQDEQKKQREDRKLEREKRDEEQKRWLEDRKAERERRDEEQQRWLKDQEAEREKRAEERFQTAVTGLGDEKDGAKIGAAILLRTFLRPGYKEFYIQTFDLAVANLRLRNVDPNTPEPLDTLSQALITVFKESFPLARDRLKEENSQFSPQSLDASHIRLDNANLNFADLEQAWMIEASLREANLFEANLSKANLGLANLSGANLYRTKLSGASLFEANLSGAKLIGASLSGTFLGGANLSGANLSGAKLGGADLSGANLSGADLSGANLSGAFLRGTFLSGTNLEDALSLKDTYLYGVTGLTKEQLEACKAKGASIFVGSTTSSSQSTISTSPPSQSNDGQAQSTPSAQGNTPTPDAGDSDATPSQQGS